MVVIKCRGATRRLGPVGLGRYVTCFNINNSKRQFAVHEDLLCAHSTFFKDRLQKRRKLATGECSICHDDFDPEVDDITFCRSTCGQNLHVQCMEQWGRSNAGVLTCPMCRKPWTLRDTKVQDVGEDLDPAAVQLYIDWLYTGTLCERTDGYSIEDWTHESPQLDFLKALTVADVFDDTHFRDAIIVRFLSPHGHKPSLGFDLKSAEYVFYE